MTNNSNSRKPTARELVAAKQVKVPTASPAKPQTTASRASLRRPRSPSQITRPYRERYLDEVAPASIVGRMVKFSKEGKFVTHDDGKEVPEDAEFTALCDETLVGWVKFNGDGEPPDRESWACSMTASSCRRGRALGDLDESQWDEGLDGEPADPWQHHQYLVLQDTKTLELFTFVTSSKTGRKCRRQFVTALQPNAEDQPQRAAGGPTAYRRFSAQDARVGFVITPVFVVCGRQPRDSVAKPDTSIGTYLNDDIPFDGGGQDDD